MTLLRWGILGTGGIARKFAEALAESQTGTLAAVGSRSGESAERFGDDYGAADRHGSYADLLANPNVDAVYISLPNHLHAEWIVRAADSGKHILCEKPLTVNHAEAMTAIEAVRRAGVFLMEAFMYRCHPQTERVAQLVRDGAIGDVRLIQSSFTYNLGPKYENIRMSNDAAGGGIMDVGCYPVSLARLIAGAEPLKVTGVAHVGDISRVDESAVASLLFPGGCVADLSCATQVASSKEARIWGSSGSIRIPEPWHPGAFDSVVYLHKAGEDEQEVSAPSGRGVYTLEADTVAHAITAGRKEAAAPAPTWADSLSNMAVLDQWRRAAGVSFDCEQPDNLPTSPLLRPNTVAGMTYGTIPGIEKKVSRLILGTVAGSIRDMPLTCALFDHYVSLGGNCLDTAKVYGNENAIGKWMELRGNREQIIVLTKGAHQDMRGPRVTPHDIDTDIANSLKALQTNYIDLYVLHRDNPLVPVGPIVECLNEHRAAGRIRAFGGSNWSAARLAEAAAYAKEHNLTPFAVSSPNFCLGVWNEPPWRECLSAVAPSERDWYVKSGFPLLAWSSQAQGFFSGLFTKESPTDANIARVWYNDDNFERLARAKTLAQEKGVTSIQIALAYVLNQPFPTFPLFGPRTIDETRSAFDSLTITLTPGELAWLNLEADSIA